MTDVLHFQILANPDHDFDQQSFANAKILKAPEIAQKVETAWK